MQWLRGCWHPWCASGGATWFPLSWSGVWWNFSLEARWFHRRTAEETPHSSRGKAVSLTNQLCTSSSGDHVKTFSHQSCFSSKARVESTTPPLGRCSKCSNAMPWQVHRPNIIQDEAHHPLKASHSLSYKPSGNSCRCCPGGSTDCPTICHPHLQWQKCHYWHKQRLNTFREQLEQYYTWFIWFVPVNQTFANLIYNPDQRKIRKIWPSTQRIIILIVFMRVGGHHQGILFLRELQLLLYQHMWCT